ncbi:MAG: lytic transglycosylase [Gammaproteobacteria bacterium]|nr:lytic transglycosylase [Gammaproteobacteria bacterium]
MKFKSLICHITVISAALILSGCATVKSSQHQVIDTVSLDKPEQVAALTQQSQQNSNSLWDAMRAGFQLNHNENDPRVQAYIKIYQNYPSYIQDIVQQGQPYLYGIVKILQERDLPTELALLPVIESGYRPLAKSSAGAVGIWQLMPQTAKRFNLSSDNWWFQGRQSINQSTDAALNYLAYLDNYFNGDWLLALAAYNSGEGTVKMAVNYNVSQGLPTDFWSLNLPQQTRNYVPQLLALAAIIDNPGKYGITLPDVPNRPLIANVLLSRQISLRDAARLAQISQSQLISLNPGYTQMATPPSNTGTYYLTLPIDKIAVFEQNLQNEPLLDQTQWKRYIVKRRDTLESISQVTGVSVATLKQYNRVGSHLHRGQSLIYPVYTYAPASQTKIYRIKPGDTLSKIASKFNVSVQDLQRWNRLNSHSKLYIGEIIAVRTPATAAPASTNLANSASTSTAAAKPTAIANTAITTAQPGLSSAKPKPTQAIAMNSTSAKANATSTKSVSTSKPATAKAAKPAATRSVKKTNSKKSHSVKKTSTKTQPVTTEKTS